MTVIETHTGTLPSIFQALAAVMEDVGPVGKRDRNTQANFNFRGIDAVVNAASPALVKHKVIVVPELLSKVYGTVEVGRNRTQMSHCQVDVAYRFYGPDGSSIVATVPGEAMDSGDKATAKAMSVAFRTALIQALSLPTDEPDPDVNSYERSTVSITDHQWVKDMEQRIKAAASTEELDALADEMKAKRTEGGLEQADYDQLWTAGVARFNQMNGGGA